MLIDKILENINDGGPKSYYAFETFILNLLKHHLNTQHKAPLAEPSGDQLGDAISPDGFDEFEGPVLFEIKFNFPRHNIGALIQKMSKCSALDSQKIRTILVISAKLVTSNTRDQFKAMYETLSLPAKCEIWGPEEINELVERYPEKSFDIAENLFTLRLETATNKATRNWKDEREEIIRQLTDLYSSGQFSLFLGAGVSSSAGMPDWGKLLSSLFVMYLTQELDPKDNIDDLAINELVSRLNAVDEPSALMAARYLRKGLIRPEADTKDFLKAITKSLYGLRNTDFLISSSLIKSIVTLCMPRRTGAKVRSVITYNFDDLLERQLNERSILHKCVYTQNETYDPDELPVYHVHGFLPEYHAGYDHLDGSTLVFSEEGYHQIYSDAYHWSNLVQLNSLRENICLMIGLSMTDPNLRRLLDIAARNIEHSKHFAFMKRLTKDRFCFEEDKSSGRRNAVIQNLKSAEQFLERHHFLNEELMKELGVTVIWYEDYEDIPEILKRIADY